MLGIEAICAAYGTQATTKVFRWAVRRAAPPCAAATMVALVSTLLHGPPQAPALAARTASGDHMPLRSSPSPVSYTHLTLPTICSV
eukprot:13613146-Alexandrium_andersonii.AAC.1